MLKKIKNLLHFFYAWYGAFKYKYPSEELLVIGITGTTGKSSVIHFLRQVLEHAGYIVGSLSTVDFYVAGEEKLNDQKMTMLGKMQIQKYLRVMLDKKCDIAIVETTSEGRLQHRHQYINYDIIVLTNFYPEHIESHGSFENYKQAKLDIFKYVSNCKVKRQGKVAIVNGQSEYADEFLQFPFVQKLKFKVAEVKANKEGLSFSLAGVNYWAPLYGEHNAENLAAVVTIVKSLKVSEEKIKQAFKNLLSAPGRIEFISEAVKHGFQVIVDYAFEPVALQKLYEVVALIKPSGRIIHVCGSTGGGRDKVRRRTIGKLVGERADIFMVTDEDPYEENPQEIIKTVSKAAQEAGKKLGVDLFEILDRKEAINKAIALAKTGDLVLVTGKGSEQAMCVKSGMIAWDDRQIVRESLKNKKITH